MIRTSGLLVFVALASTCAAQGPPDPNASAKPFDTDELAQLRPDLASMPVPDWIRAGARITFLTSSGVTEGDGEVVEDPNGYLIEKHTGKRFRWEPPRGFLDPDKHAAGHGGGSIFSVVDVAATGPGVAVIDQVDYGYNALDGTLSFGDFAGACVASGFNGRWAHPGALARLVATGLPGFVVVEMPYKMDGVDFRAVRLQGAAGSWTFDAVHGTLLRRVAIGGKPGFEARDGTVIQQTRNQVVTTMKNARMKKLPWLDAPAPAWAATLRGVTLQGSTIYVTPGQLQQPPTPLKGQYAVRGRGDGWLRYTLTLDEIGAAGIPMGVTAERACGTGSLGGLWIAPAALATLRVNQVLDEDPVTRVATVVTFAGPAPDGRPAVGIGQVSARTRIDNYYDAQTGMLKRTVLTWDAGTAKNVKTADVVATQ